MMESGEDSNKLSFPELLAGELKLSANQWEERRNPTPAQSSDQDLQCFEVDCLVHDDWMSSVKGGHVADPQVPPICQEEIHWLLQPSCESIMPQPWQRIHVMCICKPPQAVGNSRRTLVPQSSSFSTESIHEFLTQVAQENLLLSWKEVMQLLHRQTQQTPTKAALTSLFVHELVQQLYHLEVHYIKTGEEDESSVNQWTQTLKTFHSSSKTYHLSSNDKGRKNLDESNENHPNLSPLLASLESRHAFYFIYPYMRFTLFDAAMHSPGMLEDSVAKPLFVLYQLLNLLKHCHSKGATLGDISLKNVFMDARLWVQLRLPADMFKSPSKSITDTAIAGSTGTAGAGMEVSAPSKVVKERTKRRDSEKGMDEYDAADDAGNEDDYETGEDRLTPSLSTPRNSLHLSQDGSTHTLTGITDHPPPPSLSSSSPHSSQSPPALHTCEATQKWRIGELSNFDYLMLLNQHAGRVMGDPNNHPIFPWVMDFTYKDGGYRDLSKSKYRLNKGDRQLDFTYVSAQEDLRRGQDQESLVPHHIGDISSDVTYYVYLARKTPKDVLCSRVRPQWVPEEYPSTIAKMYTWTPDECIPEFYTDPSLFRSIHPDLPDLAVPEWASSPEELVSIHRGALEGDVVSAHLHNWIDLMFGYKLSGHDAVRAKNVYVSLVDKHKNPTNCGIVQLFKSSHPKRIQASSAPLSISSWNSYLSMSSLTNATTFPINQPPSNPTSRSLSTQRFASPQPSNGKTLESIIIESANTQTTPLHGDGAQMEHESQDDDFTGSFEHVDINEVKEKLRASNHTPRLPNGDIGINYGDIPSSSTTSELKNQSKPRGESIVMPTPSSRFRVPMVNMIFNRQRNKGNAMDLDGSYEWQQEKVSLPKEANLLHPLTRLEEMAHFAFKSCKDDGSMYREKWKPEDLLIFDTSSNSNFHPIIKVFHQLGEDPCYYPSFDERVALDVAAVTCTMIELCSIKQLRSATPTNPTLLQRITTIRKLLKRGQLRLPSYLSYLADFVLCPEQPGTSSLHMSSLKLPSLTPSILLQPFLPIVTFPTYFQLLYKFVYQLEQLCHSNGIDYATLDHHQLSMAANLSLKKGNSERDFDGIFAFISKQLDSLLEEVTDEGFPLLLLHIFPFFQYPETAFDAVYTFLSPLSQHMSRESIEQVFITVIIRLFDMATEPHQRGQLLSRTTSDILLKRFGLTTFLNRFLGFLIEAVIEPTRTSSKSHTSKKFNSNIIRMNSQSMLTLDLLQSQGYDHADGRGHDTSVNMSFGLSMTDPSYDSDKETSSDESEDEIAESSLLAKSSMLSGEGEMEGASQSPMILAAQTAANNPPPPPSLLGSLVNSLQSSMRMGDQEEVEIGKTVERSESGEEPLEDNISRFSILSSVQPQEPRKDLMNSYQDSVSLSSSSQFDPTQSMTSVYSQDSLASDAPFTKSLPPQHQLSPYINHLSKENSLPMGMKWGLTSLQNGFDKHYDLGSGEEREGDDTDTLEDESVYSYDPQVLAINLNVSEVAADCLAWLMRRLGPLLASQHIVRPLIEGLHRCFTGILNLRGREVAALKCLTSFTECYGEAVIKKMYFSHAENMVASATNRMTVKTEAGVAASLGIIRVSIKSLSKNTLADCSLELCDKYFLPLIQLLSSQTTFPSGGKARAAICHSMVKLLVLLGENLGRDIASTILGSTLQCFFSSFSSVHQDEQRQSTEDTLKMSTNEETKTSMGRTSRDNLNLPLKSSSPTLKHTNSASRPEAKVVDFHPLVTTSQEDPGGVKDIKESEFYRQLSTTFSKAMAHSSYITFCKLLGQYYLQDTLYNADLVEQLAYSHDEVAVPNSPLASILTEAISCDSDTDSNSSSDESDEDVGIAREAALKVGPIAAVTGLNLEEAGFRKSSWFVDLEEMNEEESASSPVGSKEGGSVSSPVKTTFLERNVATFDAKFSGVTPHPETTPAPAGGRGIGVNPPPSTSSSQSSTNEQTFAFLGAWEDLWESHLHEPMYRREGFHHFRGCKLQTYAGSSAHKGAIKCLSVSDGEHFFISGSKDKTVKIWSLRNQGHASAVGCQLTYSGHQKPVVAVELLERTDTVASCDGALHLWDPETGYLIHQFTSPRSSTFVTMRPLPSSQVVLAAATADLHLRFIDTRMKSFLHLWKLQFPTGGIIRSVACAENWISVGNHNGAVNTLDIRTGEILSLWKPADYSNVQTTTWNENLIQMKATSRGNLVTSVGNGLLSLWRPTHGKLLYHLKGQSHTTNCLEVVGDQLISAASNGNIVIHTAFEVGVDCHHFSQRTSKKTISALAALQENRLLLAGHENGQIVLLA